MNTEIFEENGKLYQFQDNGKVEIGLNEVNDIIKPIIPQKPIQSKVELKKLEEPQWKKDQRLRDWVDFFIVGH